MKSYDLHNFEDASPLHVEVGHNNTIAIYARDTLRWMRFDDSDIQSVCDLSEPWRPVAPYCLSMLAALCFRPEPAHVLNLGLGGGTFERFFSDKLPGVTLTTVESCPTVINLAKRFFELPETLKIINKPAWQFVKSCDEKFDIIFVDLFDENGHLQCAAEAEFYQDLALVISESGLIVLDIAPPDEDALLSILLAIREVFNHVLLSTDASSSNMTLILSRDPLREIEQAQTRALQLYNSLDLDFREPLQRFTNLPAPKRP